MRQNGQSPETISDIARYFNQASSPSQQETLGSLSLKFCAQVKVSVVKRSVASFCVALSSPPHQNKRIICMN